jgi:hypothetical protein
MVADTGRRVRRTIGTLVAGVLLVQFATQLQWHQFAVWFYDADIKDVARRIQQECRDKPDGSVSISVGEMHQPALEFYRKYYRIACAEPFIRRPEIELTGHDYYVYNRVDRRFAATTGLQVLMSAPVSGITLAK